jgi:tRNA-2-methylthio-N6-dimethylallyladenosine synthase
VPEEVKEQRLKKLIALQEEIQVKQQQALIGGEVEVLVDNHTLKDAEMLKGRTRCWKKVIFPGDASMIGTLQRVKVHSYGHQTLIATRCSDAAC